MSEHMSVHNSVPQEPRIEIHEAPQQAPAVAAGFVSRLIDTLIAFIALFISRIMSSEPLMQRANQQDAAANLHFPPAHQPLLQRSVQAQHSASHNLHVPHAAALREALQGAGAVEDGVRLMDARTDARVPARAASAQSDGPSAAAAAAGSSVMQHDSDASGKRSIAELKLELVYMRLDEDAANILERLQDPEPLPDGIEVTLDSWDARYLGEISETLVTVPRDPFRLKLEYTVAANDADLSGLGKSNLSELTVAYAHPREGDWSIGLREATFPIHLTHARFDSENEFVAALKLPTLTSIAKTASFINERCAAEIAKHPSLTTIGAGNINPAGLAEVLKNPRLTSLTFNSIEYRAQGDLSALGTHPSLSTFEVGLVRDAQPLHALAGNQHIAELKLTLAEAAGDGVPSLASMQGLRKLTLEQRAEYPRIYSADDIGAICNKEDLTSLSLTMDLDPSAVLAAANTKAKSLHLAGDGHLDADAVGALNKGHVQTVDIAGLRIDTAEAIALAAGPIEYLTMATGLSEDTQREVEKIWIEGGKSPENLKFI